MTGPTESSTITVNVCDVSLKDPSIAFTVASYVPGTL